MSLITALRLSNATAPSALDILCWRESMREILGAMTPQQLIVAALLMDRMTVREIGAELGITHQAVQHRRTKAREAVARAMYHCNAEHLHGDVLSRKHTRLEHERPVNLCADCECIISKQARRCQPCSNVRTGRIRREGA